MYLHIDIYRFRKSILYMQWQAEVQLNHFHIKVSRKKQKNKNVAIFTITISGALTANNLLQFAFFGEAF